MLCVTTLILGAYAISGNMQERPQPKPFIDNNITYPAPSATSQVQRANGYLQEDTSQQIFTFEQLAEISNDKLLLINRDYAVPTYISGNLVRISNYVRTLNPYILLNDDALAMLGKMFDSAYGIGFTKFRVTQGFRTYEYQEALYAAMAGSGLAAPPGYSEHQAGTAVDISYSGVNIGNSVQGTWLMNNSYRYGFILRYPEHKTEITGVPFEPWHYRYVGQPHAYFMHRNDFVLEEYIAYLKMHGEITITFNQVEFRVLYLSDIDETIELPENHSLSASRDNTGGIIVTIWN